MFVCVYMRSNICMYLYILHIFMCMYLLLICANILIIALNHTTQVRLCAVWRVCAHMFALEWFSILARMYERVILYAFVYVQVVFVYVHVVFVHVLFAGMHTSLSWSSKGTTRHLKPILLQHAQWKTFWYTFTFDVHEVLTLNPEP